MTSRIVVRGAIALLVAAVLSFLGDEEAFAKRKAAPKPKTRQLTYQTAEGVPGGRVMLTVVRKGRLPAMTYTPFI